MKDSYRRRKASLMSIIAGLEDSDLADQDVVEIDELDESIPEEIDVEDYEADDEDPFIDADDELDFEEDQPFVEEEGDSDIVAGEIEEEIEDIESSIRASEHNIRRKLARKLMAEEEACDDLDESDSVLEEIGNVEASIEASIDRIAKASKVKDEDEDKGKGAKQKKRDKSCVAYDINNTGAGAVPTTSNLYKTKVNPTSLSKIRGLKEKTKVALVQTLDRIATELENTGHVRQAFELDKISDQLED